jgi:hypothetical protein
MVTQDKSKAEQVSLTCGAHRMETESTGEREQNRTAGKPHNRRPGTYDVGAGIHHECFRGDQRFNVGKCEQLRARSGWTPARRFLPRSVP